MRYSKVFLAVLFMLCAGASLAQYGHGGKQGQPMRFAFGRGLNPAQSEFQDAMRKLWEDHVTWTRMFIVSAAANAPDKDAVTKRLLQNQTDIGNAIKPYYGNDAGDKLASLLRDHILIAADVVTAAKASDQAKLGSANSRWFTNADDISRFLSDANPRNWPYDDVRKHMHEHLKLTTDEAVAQLKGDWAGSIRLYDQVHVQALGMADLLASGIMDQFANKFLGSGQAQAMYGGPAIEIRTSGHAFVPNTLRVSRGQEVRIRMYNDSNHEHSMTFSIGGRNYSLPTNVMHGGYGEFSFKAPNTPGQYEFWCPVGDHAKRGMRGTLIVE
jgi:plastocyanin